MELYHGSPADFAKPDLKYAEWKHDFGRGFYLAEFERDSYEIVLKKTFDGYVYIYDVDDDAVYRELNVLDLCDEASEEEWARCVFENRIGNEDLYAGYDVIIGPTAGGKVNNLFKEWRRDGVEFEKVKKLIMREFISDHFGIQWCFKTPESLEYLELVDKEYYSR